MLGKIVKGLMIGSMAVAMAVPAAAQLREVNIFGASAQYAYWTEGAPQFLRDYMQCGTSDIGHAQMEDAGPAADRDAGIAICDGGDFGNIGIGGSQAGARRTGYVGDTIAIRYTTFASAEGVCAAIDTGAATDCGTPDTGCTATQRLMANEAAVSAWSDINTIPAPADTGVTIGLTCKEITLGTSDIDPICFDQSTYGPKNHDTWGPEGGRISDWETAMGGGIFGKSKTAFPVADDAKWWIRIFTPIEPDLDLFTVFEPIIVPFSFFVNEASLGGEVTNLSRPQAQMLFSQQVTDWNTFGYSSQDVVVCIRHAGSGTHATLDWSVVRPQSLAQIAYAYDESAVTSGVVPRTLTNKGSSDEIECVGSYAGAVGYADSDKKGDLTNPCESGACRVNYQGYIGKRDNIRNGRYDFWGANYVIATNADAAQTHVAALMAYMSNPTNLDATSKYEFWASQDEMKVIRDSCKTGISVK